MSYPFESANTESISPIENDDRWLDRLVDDRFNLLLFFWRIFMSRPNLFNYATSELSQDAFLCWFLAWADSSCKDEDAELHLLAKEFVAMLINSIASEDEGDSNVNLDQTKLSVKIQRQYKDIDILCTINDEYQLIIEDKVGTKNHSDQLNRYLTIINKENESEGKSPKVIPVYIQTGDQSDYSSVYDSDFSVIDRSDMLDLMSKRISNINNDIIVDYYDRLKNKDILFNAFHKIPVDDWRGHAVYQGFFTALSTELEGAKWDYVPNPSGGFYGIWWHFRSTAIEQCNLYLQANSNESKLLFKIHVNGKNSNERSALRNKFYHAVMKNNTLKTLRPQRFGNGTYMTVALTDQQFPITDENGVLDMEATLALIKQAEQLVDEVASNLV